MINKNEDKYNENVFFDIFICIYNHLSTFKTFDDNDTIFEFEFYFENYHFYFKYDNFVFDIGNILAYNAFCNVFVSMIVNYGFSIIVDNNVMNDIYLSITDKGTVCEKINVIGKIEQFEVMYMYETNKEKKKMLNL